MDLVLTESEVRVLGSLIEKDITTPDYYPLSLNALMNACNQKSNRDPFMQLDENAVRDALEGLQEHRLAGPARGADSRVTKYEHRTQEVFNFTRGETAVLCVLLLRGPQTPGELRGRTERMHHFETLDDVQTALQKLMQRQPALAKVLPRQPGMKESRYVHLLAGMWRWRIFLRWRRPGILPAMEIGWRGWRRKLGRCGARSRNCGRSWTGFGGSSSKLGPCSTLKRTAPGFPIMAMHCKLLRGQECPRHTS